MGWIWCQLAIKTQAFSPSGVSSMQRELECLKQNLSTTERTKTQIAHGRSKKPQNLLGFLELLQGRAVPTGDLSERVDHCTASGRCLGWNDMNALPLPDILSARCLGTRHCLLHISIRTINLKTSNVYSIAHFSSSSPLHPLLCCFLL